MRIHVQGLPFNQNFITKFQISPSFFENKTTKHGEAEIHFLEPVECNAILRKMSGDEVLLQVSSTTTIEPVCDRCTEFYTLPFSLETSLLCKPMTHKPNEQEEEDEGLVFFTKQEIHLDQIVKEQILLNLPIQCVCKENCQGLCPGCGDNLNFETNGHECRRSKFVEYKSKVF